MEAPDGTDSGKTGRAANRLHPGVDRRTTNQVSEAIADISNPLAKPRRVGGNSVDVALRDEFNGGHFA